MARPKGSKNKSTVEREEPKEFDYERDDASIDGSYQTSLTIPTGVAAEPWTMTEVVELVESQQRGAPMPVYSPMTAAVGAGLFLVEGDVQLSSREPGRGSMVAKQTRLVSANNDNEAIQKYSNYFSGLSDSNSVYAVIRAAAMETIS